MAETDGGLNETEDLRCITITRIEYQRREAIHVHRLIWFPDLEPTRIEYQRRGSIHVHRLIWFPDLEPITSIYDALREQQEEIEDWQVSDETIFWR